MINTRSGLSFPREGEGSWVVSVEEMAVLDIQQAGNVSFLKPSGSDIVFMLLLFLKLNIKVNNDLYIIYFTLKNCSNVVEFHIESKTHSLLGLR